MSDRNLTSKPHRQAAPLSTMGDETVSGFALTAFSP